MTKVQIIEQEILDHLRARRGQEVKWWSVVDAIARRHGTGTNAIMEARRDVLPVMTQLHRDRQIIRTRPAGRFNGGMVRIHEAHA